MTTKARQNGYKRMDVQVRCECGAQATHQVSVRQLRISDLGRNRMSEYVAVLVLCDRCYQEFQQIERVTA